MTIYAEFDDEFRPRPALWRMAVVGVCQLILAVWLVQAAMSAADMAILRKARVEKLWIVDAVPWQTLKGDLAKPDRGDVSDFAVRADREYASWNHIAAGAFVVLALLVLFFVPGSLSLANRLFTITFAQACAVFGGAFGLRRCLSAVCHGPELILLAAIGLVAAIVVLTGEWKVSAMLAGIFTMSPGRRIAIWAARMLPGCAALAAISWYAHNQVELGCAVTLAALTLVANLIRKPASSGERVDGVELVEASAALPAIVAILLAAAFWAFGIGARAVLVSEGRARRVAWSEVRAQLSTIHDESAPTRPKIDIHWSRRPRTRGKR
ncbi:MAG: hypothetical protein ABI837_07770 [Acidobacteriota bacterium]